MTGINRRGLLAGGAAMLTCSLPLPAQAQTWPQRAVRLVVPYAPGGGTDVFSRLLGSQIERELGQALVIDNRGGGASVIGTQAVASAQPDGYTLGMMDSAFVTNPGLFRDRLPYNTQKDFVTISLLARSQLVLAVPDSSPFKTAQELIAHAKANPGKLTFASAGIGTGIHLAGEQFRQVTDTNFVIVPYRGGGPSLVDLISAKVDFTFNSVATIGEYIRTGRARGLGVTRGRAPQLPEIPSMDEIGLGAVDSASEMGLVAPASTPEPIVARLQQVAASAVKDPAFRQRLLDVGFQPIGSSQDEFRAHVEREIVKWRQVIAAGNIRPE